MSETTQSKQRTPDRGPTAEEIFYKIGALMRNSTREPRAFEFLKQKISLEIQKGNVAAILNTAGNLRGLDEIFWIQDAGKSPLS